MFYYVVLDRLPYVCGCEEMIKEEMIKEDKEKKIKEDDKKKCSTKCCRVVSSLESLQLIKIFLSVVLLTGYVTMHGHFDLLLHPNRERF